MALPQARAGAECQPAICEIIETVGTGDDIDDRGLLDWLAGVEGLEMRELGVTSAQDIGGALEHAAAFQPGH
jgi:hypothetical protein